MPVAESPENVEIINNFTASVCAEHPALIPFGALHKDMGHPLEEIERIERLGFKGIKFHPDMQRFNIDDEGMFEIYSMLEGRLPVLFHCGDNRFSFSHPKRLRRVLTLFPRLTAVAAHLGGWSLFEQAVDHLLDKSCYLDMSSSVMFLGKQRAEELIRLYGAERIVFGSDYPMWNPAEEYRVFLGLSLSQEEKDLISFQNALRILQIGQQKK
jgi:predicted TIM-barrel fold metal-dependent hydrolase